jgi:hypothetical protein
MLTLGRANPIQPSLKAHELALHGALASRE